MDESFFTWWWNWKIFDQGLVLRQAQFLFYSTALCDLLPPCGGWYFHETPGDRNLGNQQRLTNNTRFNTEITKAFWNEKTSKWELTAKESENESALECNWLISCIGGLHKPMIPEFKGRETFKGRTFSCSSSDALARVRWSVCIWKSKKANRGILLNGQTKTKSVWKERKLEWLVMVLRLFKYCLVY